MLNDIVMATERLALRRFVLADADDLYGQLSDPDVMRYYDGPMSREQSDKWLQGILNDHKTNGFGMYAVCLKETGEYMGQAGVMRRPDGETVCYYLAYLIRREFWGNGYATEAARAVVDNAFRNLGATRIVALIDPGNERSIRLAERLGLQRDSIVRHMGRDHYLYVLALSQSTEVDFVP